MFYKKQTRMSNDHQLLFQAIEEEKVEAIESLLCNGVDVNIKNSDGSTPLHWAIQMNKNVEIIKCLIENGANVSAKNNDGSTLLHEAAMWNDNVEVSRLLVSNGADVNANDEFGITPLDLAREKGNMAIAEYLSNVIQ